MSTDKPHHSDFNPPIHRNPYPEGAEHGMFVFLRIGINRSGIDSGNVDFALNSLAFDQMSPARKAETVETLKALVRKFETE